ncbi:hypothetical protein [Pseudomonas graminis]
MSLLLIWRDRVAPPQSALFLLIYQAQPGVFLINPMKFLREMRDSQSAAMLYEKRANVSNLSPGAVE